MARSAGTRLGPYEIVSAIGAGGMGEVYRARDTKLGRDVALKILPDAFAADPDRLARFAREARVLASLNHPHIAGIYGLEEAAGVRALVLELVEGPTLAERIAQGPIPLEDALPIAHQIADALAAAHEQGIIHRDLKPANVKLRPDGTVKVLDFGLAKALADDVVGPDASLSPTFTAAGTRAGVILGTAAYMSPEQARGKTVDKRADIWAFGCVLYEMLAGRRTFGGDDVTDTLAFVMTKDPDWAALPWNTPAPIQKLLRRCLEKDRKRRLADISDARLEIDEALTPQSADAGAVYATAGTPGWRRAAPWVTAAMLAVGLGLVLLLWAPWRSSQAAAPLRLSVELGSDASLTVDQGSAVTLSPDGAVVAFVARKDAGGRSQLYTRRLEELHATPLPGTDGARNPFFSPDGQWIAFFADGKLKKISVTGAAPVALCDARDDRGGAWAEDGTIVFVPNLAAVSLLRVSSAGGTPEPLTTLDQSELTQRWPQVLPGGKAVLYTSHSSTSGWRDANLVVQPLPTGTRKVVHRGGYYGRFLSSGHLVYVHDGTLFAAPFDLDLLEMTGPVVPALEGITDNLNVGAAQLAMSGNGTLVYLPRGGVTPDVPISWMDRKGKTTTLRATPTNWYNILFPPMAAGSRWRSAMTSNRTSGCTTGHETRRRA